MIKFPGQFHSYRKTTIGDNIVSFTIDRLYSKSVSELVETDIGTEFIVYLEPTTQETNINEDSNELLEKWRRQLHAQLSELAKKKGTTQKEEKNKLRDILIKKGLIIESTKELNLKGYAVAINIVQEWLNGTN